MVIEACEWLFFTSSKYFDNRTQDPDPVLFRNNDVLADQTTGEMTYFHIPDKITFKVTLAVCISRNLQKWFLRGAEQMSQAFVIG